MAHPAVKNYITAQEYLEQERAATEKHEYYQGEVFAMSGARLQHNRIQMNFTGEARIRLRGKSCEVFGSDLRVHIPANTLFTYPDAVIVCGKPELLDEAFDTLLNPVVIVEILSRSTQSYDRGDKFMLYRAIPSLKEYVMIDSESIGIEHYSRQEDGTWLFAETKDPASVLQLLSLGISFPISLLYEGVEL
ncbi:Uma2 family endonuclease [Paraflavisolibacter sp. H34]|uniref:Uma2 family endonuclease n=1 Tax=Huijunlia imazamoxiresistens TaxID=3127457 RepID=UPI0030193A46